MSVHAFANASYLPSLHICSYRPKAHSDAFAMPIILADDDGNVNDDDSPSMTTSKRTKRCAALFRYIMRDQNVGAFYNLNKTCMRVHYAPVMNAPWTRLSRECALHFITNACAYVLCVLVCTLLLCCLCMRVITHERAYIWRFLFNQYTNMHIHKCDVWLNTQ